MGFFFQIGQGNPQEADTPIELAHLVYDVCRNPQDDLLVISWYIQGPSLGQGLKVGITDFDHDGFSDLLVPVQTNDHSLGQTRQFLLDILHPIEELAVGPLLADGFSDPMGLDWRVGNASGPPIEIIAKATKVINQGHLRHLQQVSPRIYP